MHPTAAVHSLVRHLEERLLPVLRNITVEVPRWNPRATATIFTNPIGSNTDLQGWTLGIACILSDARENEPDEVALMVSLCHLERDPRVNADVAWNTGIIEAEYVKHESNQEWPLATEQEVNQVVEFLPRLLGALEIAVRSGSARSAA